MKRKNISKVIDNISPKYIDEAAEYGIKAKQNSRFKLIKWGAVAACFVAFSVAIAVILPSLLTLTTDSLLLL